MLSIRVVPAVGEDGRHTIGTWWPVNGASSPMAYHPSDDPADSHGPASAGDRASWLR